MTATGSLGQTGVVERVAQVLGAAAVALIQPHHVEAGRERLFA